MKKLSKLVFAAFLIASTFSPIKAETIACTASVNPLDVVKVNYVDSAFEVAKVKKSDKTPIAVNDDINIDGTLFISLGNLATCKATNSDVDSTKVSASLTIGNDSYVYNDRRNMNLDTDITVDETGRNVEINFVNKADLKYLGGGSTVHITGSVRITSATLGTFTVPINHEYHPLALGGATNKSADELTEKLFNTAYRLSTKTLKKDTAFDIAIDMVDPNIMFKDITSGEFKSSYVILTSSAFNATNKVGTVTNLHANEQGYLAYTVNFKDVYWLDAGTLDFSINYEVLTYQSGVNYTVKQKKDYALTVFETKNTKEETEEDVLKPNIIITNYSGISNITAGSQAAIGVTFTNTSSSTAIENLVFTVNPGNAFSIASGVNKFYVEKLEPKSSYTLKVTLNCLKNAEVGSHTVEVVADGQYGDAGNQLQQSNSLTIPVSQIDRTKISYVKMNDVYTNSESEVRFSIQNNGRAPIYNTNIEILDGDEVLEQLYLGTIESGAQQTNSSKNAIYLTFTEGGYKTLTMHVTYEDDNMTQYELNQDFDVNIQSYSYGGYDEPTWNDPIVDPVVEPENNKTPYYIGGGVVVVAIAAFFFIRSKKKKKLTEDEDL